MSQEHEYAILNGCNRARIGQYIGMLAALVSGLIVTVFLLLVDVAKRLGWGEGIPPLILWPVSGFAIYVCLYWIFDTHAWKWRWIFVLLKVPNLAGEWSCKGQTLNQDKSQSYAWSARITIVQTWDRIRVRLRTSQSGSNSITAALVCDEADGYRLLYAYENTPRISEKELSDHRGFAAVTFAKDLGTAEGEYFNGHGRFTFGTMFLTREN